MRGQNTLAASQSNFIVLLTKAVSYDDDLMLMMTVMVPVAERSKAWVCSRSPAAIAGSNPAGGMDVCLF